MSPIKAETSLPTSSVYSRITAQSRKSLTSENVPSAKQESVDEKHQKSPREDGSEIQFSRGALLVFEQHDLSLLPPFGTSR